VIYRKGDLLAEIFACIKHRPIRRQTLWWTDVAIGMGVVVELKLIEKW